LKLDLVTNPLFNLSYLLHSAQEFLHPLWEKLNGDGGDKVSDGSTFSLKSFEIT
jgi:hypothetical protein